MAYLRMLGHLIRYTFCASFLVSTLGILLILWLPVIFFTKSRERWNEGVNGWLCFDIVCAWVCYGTRYRTISGIVGQRSFEDKGKRYALLEKIIDWLAKLFGDDEHHCYRAYLWEKQTIFDAS